MFLNDIIAVSPLTHFSIGSLKKAFSHQLSAISRRLTPL
jgi:hypothetical protein